MDILTLEAEATSASSLASHGISALERLSSAATEADPVLACLALASEKMLKMTIGMTSMATGEPWPDRRRMQGYSHGITKMNREAMGLLMQRLDKATHPPVVLNAALTSVDVTWTSPLLAALSDYGSGGRFYNLDTLAGEEHKFPSPAQMWRDMEDAVIAAHPEVLEFLAASGGSNAEARGPLNAKLATAFRNWWAVYATAWKHGLAGDEARPLGWVIALDR
ncbi:hypothetical protein [Arthrobacter sp. Soil763]|uniref:hypothetical protein n=1 Tax=Arthrobacter sp. Soil763 TaxID=1736402 RepID=UPI0006F4EB47|nr:hypothetical protein [Arthrobacter sp. Soil763]KRE79913.1 hypothetical protein ASG71_07710 [Arthrobacter sp. Soil763]